MKKKQLDDLVGKTINHKKFGLCKVDKVIDFETKKVACVLESTNEVKSFIFSSQFFEGVDEYITAKVAPKVVKKAIVYKQPDYQKHRSHALVKEIDRKEMRIQKLVDRKLGIEDDDDDDE